MKITLLQNEIEHAIREHINKTLDLPEGTKIDFDDEDGISAIIDLNPGNDIKDTSTTPKTRRPYTRRQRAEGEDVKGDVEQAPAAHQEPAQAAAPAVEVPKADVTPIRQPEEAAETAGEQPAGEAQPEGERKSIFGGLKRPVNS